MPVQKTRSRLLLLHKWFVDFSGGQNSLFTNSSLLKENESPSCQNVRLRAKGTVSKRGGTETQNVPVEGWPAQGIHALYRKNGDKFLFYVIHGVLYSHDATADWDEDAIIRDDLSTTNKVRFVTYRDQAYVADGANAIFRTDGTTYTLIPAAPVSTLVTIYKNHVFAVDPANPNRMVFSELDDPDTWPVLNFIEVNSDDGDRITAYEVGFRGRLLIWKERAAGQLLGDCVANFELNYPRCNYGTISQESVCIIGDMIFFLSREGVVTWNLSDALLVSEKIEPDIARINQAAIAQSAAITFQKEYHISVPCDGSLTNNRTLVFDTLRAAWIVDIGYYPGVWCLWAPEGADLLYSGHASQGRIVEHECAARNDDGVAIDAWWTSREENFDLDTPKVFRGLRLHFETQSVPSDLEIYISRDHGAFELLAVIDTQLETAQWDDATWDGSIWDEMATAKAYGISDWFRATMVSYRFRNKTVDDNFGLLRWGAFYSGRQASARPDND